MSGNNSESQINLLKPSKIKRQCACPQLFYITHGYYPNYDNNNNLNNLNYQSEFVYSNLNFGRCNNN